MSLLLTSDFPSTVTESVLESIRSIGTNPRVAWIPPLTWGDPLVFRRNIERCGIAEGLRSFLTSGRVIVAASGGAMPFTANVSIYRLLSDGVDAVVAERGQYAGLGLASYELLPHLNRLEPAFVAKVQHYSERVPGDIVALEDGAAIVHGSGDGFRCIGRAFRFRGGVRSAIEAAA